MADRPKLDFICIGAQKSGTTWLYKALKQHPDIHLASKEKNFFSDKHPFYVQLHTKKYVDLGYEWYYEQVDPVDGKLDGDISTNYIWDAIACKRIKKDYPDVKIIAIIRNPIERARSQYLYAGRYFDIGKTFGKAVRKHPELRERGLFYKQLKPYFDAWPKDKVHVIILEDVKCNPEAVLRKVHAFLDLKYVAAKDIGDRVNKARVPKYPWMTSFFSFVHRIKASKAGQAVWTSWPIANIAQGLERWFHYHGLKEADVPPIDAKTKKYLINYYKEDVKKLEKLLGRDLSFWLS